RAALRDGRPLARGVRRRLRRAAHPPGGAAEARRLRALLPAPAPDGRARHPARRGRLLPARPARRRPAGRAAGTVALPARTAELDRLPPGRHPLRPPGARGRRGEVLVVATLRARPRRPPELLAPAAAHGELPR